MSDYPERTPLLPNEQIIHSSGGAVSPASLFLEEPGTLSRPITGKVFVTNMRLVFEGKLPASGAKAVAVGAIGAVLLGPLGATAGTLVKGDEVTLVIPHRAISRVSKYERIGTDLIEVHHSQQGANSPFYFSPAKDKDGVQSQLKGLMSGARGAPPPPPPPGVTTRTDLPPPPPPPDLPRSTAPPPSPPPETPRVVETPSPPELSVTEDFVFCGSCGTQVKEGLNFCTNCGARIERKPKECPSCGSQVSPDMNFCGNCGSKLT